MNTPSIHVIRHWIAWGPSDDCPDELIEHDSNRLDQFEAWLAEVKAEAWQEGERRGRDNERALMMCQAQLRPSSSAVLITNPYRQGETE